MARTNSFDHRPLPQKLGVVADGRKRTINC
jgi:hypothetical protein